MSTGTIGKIYEPGEVIIRQGEPGDRMYVIQEGHVEVVLTGHTGTVRLAVLGEGDFFGEMEIFMPDSRLATVRALDRARILTVDKKMLLRGIQQDPSLALHLLETMSGRLRQRNEEILVQNRRVPEA